MLFLLTLAAACADGYRCGEGTVVKGDACVAEAGEDTARADTDEPIDTDDPTEDARTCTVEAYSDCNCDLTIELVDTATFDRDTFTLVHNYTSDAAIPVGNKAVSFRKVDDAYCGQGDPHFEVPQADITCGDGGWVTLATLNCDPV